jgi:hypothetical protein
MAAPLTWRNVDAPDFRGSLAGLQVFNDSIKTAFGGLSTGIEAFKTDRAENADKAGLAAALQFQDPAAYKAALATGALAMPNMSAKGLATLDARAPALANLATVEQALATAKIQDPLRTTKLEGENEKLSRENRLGDATFVADAARPGLLNEQTRASTDSTRASAESVREGTRFSRATFNTRADQLTETLTGTRDTNQRNRTTFDRGTEDRDISIDGVALADTVRNSGVTPEQMQATIAESGASPRVKAAALAALSGTVGNIYTPTANLYQGGVSNTRTDNLSASAEFERIEADPNMSPAQKAEAHRQNSLRRAGALGQPVNAQFRANPGVNNVYAGVPAPGQPALQDATDVGNRIGVAASNSQARGVTAADLATSLPSNADQGTVVDALLANGTLKGANRDIVVSKLMRVMQMAGVSAPVAGDMLRRGAVAQDGPLDQLDRAVFSLGGLTPSQLNTDNLGNGFRFDDTALDKLALDYRRNPQNLANVLSLGQSFAALQTEKDTAAAAFSALDREYKETQRMVESGARPGARGQLDRLGARRQRALDALTTITKKINEDPSVNLGADVAPRRQTLTRN